MGSGHSGLPEDLAIGRLSPIEKIGVVAGSTIEPVTGRRLEGAGEGAGGLSSTVRLAEIVESLQGDLPPGQRTQQKKSSDHAANCTESARIPNYFEDRWDLWIGILR